LSERAVVVILDDAAIDHPEHRRRYVKHLQD
jgi:hypothetical protein